MQPNSKRNIIISHEGLLDFETIGILIGQLQHIMKDLGVKVFIYKKILSIMIESLENIYKYYTDVDLEDISPEHVPNFIIEKVDDRYVINVGNPVKNKDIERLKSRIEHINTLDKEGLKALYKNTITDGKFTEKGGAGLGFIEMAKLAVDKLGFTFEKINDNYSVYNLTIIV